MRLRNWLADVFCEEATGAGEGAGGTAVEASPHAEKLAEWVAERTGTEDTPITTEATATTAEPLDQEIPVETTSTDAVSDDDAAPETTKGEETGLDPLLMSFAEAYDYTPEDVKGFDNEGLKRLLARERRLRGNAAPAAEAPKPEIATATVTTPARQAPAVEADTTPKSVTFADEQAILEEKLSEEGLSDAAIQREVKLAKLRWDREEAILTDGRKARSETEQMRQELQRQQAEYEWKLEMNSVLDVVDDAAKHGLSLLGIPGAKKDFTELEYAARTKVVNTYNALKATHPGTPAKTLAAEAIHIAFSEEIEKREAKSRARALINQSNRVLASGLPSQSNQQDSSGGKRDWMKIPAIARIARKHQINVG